MQQTLDDADLLAANLDGASIKQQVNSDAMKEAVNAVSIFKIKLIASLDQKIEMLAKRREELVSLKDKTAEKASKISEHGGDVATTAQAVLGNLQEYHKAAEEYLQTNFGGVLAR